MKKMYSLDSKLKLYSTLALGVLGATTAKAQVVYHDVNPDVTLTGVSGTASRDSLQMDINADGTDDFQMQVRVYGTTPTNTQANLNTYATGAETLASLVSYTSLGYALDVPSGTAINASSAWNGNVQAVLASLYGTTNYGTLGDAADHFLGIQFQDGSANVYYGWVRIGGVDANGTTVTIKDWAYQSTAATSINAGEMPGAGISTNLDQVTSKIFAFNHKIVANFSEPVTGTIKVYNTLGELVLSSNVEGLRKEISAENLSGIFMVQVESAGKTITQKISL
jgi:hypothetical protein